ncbi:MAG: DNA polymerase III subunit delta' [Planctomycetota bacterium]
MTGGGWVRGGGSPPAAAREQPSLAVPLGQDALLAPLLERAAAGRLHHGQILAGERGRGKRTLARWIAAALLCESPSGRGACARCPSCAQVARGTHPDLRVVRRARDEQEARQSERSVHVIRIGQIREAREALLRHAFCGGARVLLIEEADRLDESGQNALLKTLEEPGERMFLLMTVRRPDALLPTVRSRAETVRLLPLPDFAILAELRRRLPEASARHERAVRIANGSLGFALEACSERMVQLHDLVLSALADIDRLRPVAAAREILDGQRRGIETSVQARDFLSLLRLEISSRMRALEARTPESYSAAESDRWCRWIELALAADADVSIHVPAEQALVACLLRMQE